MMDPANGPSGDVPAPNANSIAAAPGPGDGAVAALAAEATDRRRSGDLALARLHLRLGSLALARAELEALAGRDALDEEGLLDLVEARWRTGDLVGADEAATVLLRDDDDGPLIALVVAAEACLHRGRPTEARRFANRAVELAGAALDDVFAGMPRGGVWPPDAMATVGPMPTLFEGLTPAAGVGRAALPGPSVAPLAAVGPAAPAGPAAESVTGPEAVTLALWGEMAPEDAAVERPVGGPADRGADTFEPDLPSGLEALRLGRAALEDGRLDDAAAHLSLAVRLDPAIAPAIIDVLGGHRERELAFARGDAYRLLGRDADARRAYADALARPAAERPGGTPPTDPRPTDHPPEGDPA